MRKKITGKYGLSGVFTVPADKSIAHRALILNALAEGDSIIGNFPMSSDCLATLDCINRLGIETKLDGTKLTVCGKGYYGLKEPGVVLNAGNSATTMRLLAGVLAAQPFSSVITGDASLRGRPMDRIIAPLSLMGADISSENNDGLAPLIIKGRNLCGLDYEPPVPSAQIKSCLLLAGLYANGAVTVREPVRSRNHTEIMLANSGAHIKTRGGKITLACSNKPLVPISMDIPGDFSSAAYLIAAALIQPHSRVRINGVCVNKTRTGIVPVLRKMGADIRLLRLYIKNGEAVADIIAESSALYGAQIVDRNIPFMIDEIPLFALISAHASGKTVIKNISELRNKETDRLFATVSELKKMGADIEEIPDGMVIMGKAQLKGAEVDARGDHRLEMMLAVAGMSALGQTVINNAGTTDVSFPGFYEMFGL